MFQIIFCFQAKITEIAIGDISSEQFFLSENYIGEILYWNIISFVSFMLEKAK